MKQLFEKLTQGSKEENEIIEQKILNEGEQFNIFPLSTAQERLWFLSQFESDDPAYNISVAIKMTGNLHADIFEESFRKIIERHEILRTTFHSLNGKPWQAVNNEFDFSVSINDLKDIPQEEREKAALEFAVSESQKPFDLEQCPLLRVFILKVDVEKHIAVVTLHHIVADGWSMGIIINELTSLYRSISEDKEWELPELSIQYADFAVWEKDNLKSEKIFAELNYWKENLRGDLPVLQLPTDRPRPLVQDTKGSRFPIKISEDLTKDLKKLANNESVTLFMLLLAAFKTLLYRYSAQEDICVGTSIAGRTNTETENLIGFFLNTLVIRSMPKGNRKFTDFLASVKQKSLEAFNNQTVPVEMLIDQLSVERNTSHNPLFQVLFILQNTPVAELKLGELKLEEIHLDTKTSKFDLTIDIVEKDNQIKGWLEFSTALFDEETIARLVEHFQNTLESIIKNPDQKIGEISILSKKERAKLIDYQLSENLSSGDSNLVKAIIDQTKKTPDAVAIRFKDEELTYAELDTASNRLCNYLLDMGVKEGQCLGLSIERSIIQIVAILGILKAKAAYLPIDVNYPLKRIEYIVKDSGIEHILVNKNSLDEIENDGLSLINLDKESEKINSFDSELSISLPTSNHPAYVIYTSGSTGLPKGVIILHGAITNFVEFAKKYYEINPSDRILQFATYSFDASLEEIFPTLFAGATLVLRTEEMISTASEFFQKCDEWGITVLDLPTAYWSELVMKMESELLELPKSVRLVIIGGEKVALHYVQKWKNLTNGQVKLVNSYGPTEAAVVATVQEISHQTKIDEWKEVPIGQTIENVQAFVLDRNFEPVPLGVIGELYLGGKCLAYGYLQQPDMTAEKFVPNPFSAKGGERLYRTGDLACYKSYGQIEFCGRSDDQLKVRGFRVSPSEIISSILTHNEVAEAVVLPETFENTVRLKAFFTEKKEGKVSAGDLREHLSNSVPKYMIPSRLIKLAEMPLTPNGKLDMKTLQTLEDDSVEEKEDFQLPITETETVIASIWSEILHIEKIGRNQNFFELGGHSLLGTRVTSHIRKIFGIELPLRTLFETQDLASLAKAVDNKKLEDDGIELPKIEKTVKERVRLSFAQERLWFLQQLNPDKCAYNVIRPIRFRGKLNVSALETAFNQLIERHETYRTVFPKIDGIGYIKVNEPKWNILETIDYSHLPDDEREDLVEHYIEKEGQTPFEVVNSQLWRLKLLKLDKEDHLLMLTEHHLIHDGWTEGRLVAEFLHFYQFAVDGKSPELEELPIQYKDYANWQRQCYEDGHFDTQIEFWQEKLKGELPELSLPTDRPRPATETFNGDTYTRFLSSNLANKLYEYCRKNDVTVYMVVLAVFSILLHRYSRQEDILIASPIAGRNRVELENLIGFFVNTLLMRNDLSGNPTFREYLERTKKQCFETYANQDVPFEEIVKKIQPERSLSKQSLFQVMLVLHNAESPDLVLPEMEVTSIRAHNHTAKFDFLFHIREEVDGIRLAMEYSTDLFNESTIDRLLEHFENLLEAALESETEEISKLNILSKWEKERVLTEWNQTEASYDRILSIAERFEEQVDKTPDLIAVKFGKKSLTYADLDKRANQIAHHLRNLGVGIEIKVGICLQRSLDMIGVVLGILKCGGVYVPIDVTYPNQRIQYILEDASVSILVTEGEFLSKLPEELPDVFLIDQEESEISKCSQERLPIEANSENLVYITYTSGSTGKPKGIGMVQSSLLNLLDWMLENTDIPPQSKTLQFASLSFDVSFQDIFSTLLSGGTLVLITEDQRLDIKGLAKLIYDEGVHRIFIPAVAFQQLAEGFCNMDLHDAALAKVIAGSEQLHITPKIIELFTKLTNARLHNEYGPSEAHVVTELMLEGKPETWHPRPSVGRPISNIKIYILDKNMNPVPIGVPGDLYISGAGLARGYLTQSDTTAEKFIPNPFSDKSGCRMYSTGDLARFLEDGNIEFLGRADYQLKIRGYRIEPEEVEINLTKYPDILDAVVISRKYSDFDNRLIAYVVARNKDILDLKNLRSYLKANLPDYMIPSSFTFLDKIPLNVNGKVDRKNLPEPTDISAQLKADYVAPESELEIFITDIWKEVIELEKVGVKDNFFEIGGHSLLATQVISHISDTFEIDVPLRLIFENPIAQDLCIKLLEYESKERLFEKTAKIINQINQMSDDEAEEKLKTVSI